MTFANTSAFQSTRSTARLGVTACVIVSLTLSAAIFGFFYAWVCSTLWGLDTIDPRTAITAMNAMNESVRNAVFAPAFFGTPIALLVTSAIAMSSGSRNAALWFGVAALVYVGGAFLPTMLVNVPMNRALLATGAPEQIEDARAIWAAYSAKWQAYNALRTVFAGCAFGCAIMGLVRLVRR